MAATIPYEAVTQTKEDNTRQDASTESYTKSARKDTKKVEITPSELPEEVKSSIMKGDYAQWNIMKAYIITYPIEAEKVEYEVHFTKEKTKEDKEIEVFNKEGKIVEE